MTLRDSQNTAILIESNYFASGGEGNVYRIISPNKYQNYCVKLFHGDKVFSRLDKLEYMINHPLRIPSNTFPQILNIKYVGLQILFITTVNLLVL